MSSKASRVVLPVLELEQNDKPYVKSVLKGVKELQVFRVNSDSHSDSQCSFSWQPPSQNTILDRRFEMEVELKLVNSGTAPIAALDPTNNSSPGTYNTLQNIGFNKSNVKFNPVIQTAGTFVNSSAAVNAGEAARIGNNLAPRQFPLASIMDTIDLTINGTHFTVSPNQYIHAVMKYSSPEYRDKVFQEGFGHPDVAQYGITAGHDSHPLNLINEGGRKGEKPRGENFSYTLSTTTHANDTLTYTLREPLFISPLMMEYGHGMTNINDLSVQINWNSDLKRTLSLIAVTPAGASDSIALPTRTSDNRVTAAGIAVSMTTKSPQLVMRYYTPQSDIKIPNEIVLPYKQPKIQTMAAVAVNSGSSHTYNGNSIRLNQIPECVYLFGRKSRATQSVVSEDIHLLPTKVSIQWGVKTGVLNGANSDDLLQIAVENGADTCRGESNEGGFALKLIYGKDIPLDDNEAPGTRGDYNWQVDFTGKNNLATGNWEFVQVFIYNGHAVISPNECSVQTGVLDLRDNVEASDMGDKFHHTYGEVSGGSPIGGAFNPSHLLKKTKEVFKMAKDLKPCADAAMGAYEKYKTRA